MASLEFAFLAEFAKVETNATITAVGAGVRGVLLNPRHEQIGVYLAGCVNRAPGEEAGELTVTTVGPEGIFALERTIDMEPVEDGASDFATTVFAVRQDVPIAGEGRYEFRLSVGEEESKKIELWIKIQSDVDVDVDLRDSE